MKAQIAKFAKISILVLLGNAQPVTADALKVAVDIAPLGALVARVAEATDVTITVLVPPGGEPHDHALRPSDMRALQNADLVVQIGPELTPWLPSISPRITLYMLDIPETRLHGKRQGAALEPVPGTRDLHAWLDPTNAVLWSRAIAKVLARIDPSNAQRFAANAEAASAEIAAASAWARTRLNAKTVNFVLEHDAFQYFEVHFGLTPRAALRDAEGSRPGPRRMARFRRLAEGADCLIGSPGTQAKLAQTLNLDRLIVLDPLGATESSYPALIMNLAQGYAACSMPSQG